MNNDYQFTKDELEIIKEWFATLHAISCSEEIEITDDDVDLYFKIKMLLNEF